MAFPVSEIVQRLRWKMDLHTLEKDILPQDGEQYVVVLSARPVLSGTNEVYLQHSTFTTGVPQFVYQNGFQPGHIESGNNKIYTIDYERGELKFFEGSGLSTAAGSGLVPFAPWSTSDVIAYYESSTYSDDTLADYASYAVAPVEMRLQLGMYVSGINGAFRPVNRDIGDNIEQRTGTPYQTNEKIIIADDVEVLQDLIAQRAMLDILTRERRIGAGNAIKIVDGDTQIDTSVNQRYLADFLKDIKKEYEGGIKAVLYYMSEGYTIQQIDETIWTQFNNPQIRIT